MADDATADFRQVPGVITINGKPYMTDAKDRHVPLETVKAEHLLEDELVRKIIGYAAPLSDQIARFRQHTFDDVDNFVALLEQEYGARRGGSKGNLTFTTYDGLVKVKVSVADLIVFGPQLQVAKGLIDACMNEWSADSRAEIRALVNDTFNVDQPGTVNRSGLFSLLRLASEDERWNRAMDAIRDSIRVVGSKRYVNIYRRANATAGWEHVSIDAASSGGAA